MTVPATIRNKNPGAQYPGPVSRAFGSRAHEVIGGGHKIATFPTSTQGAAAQMYLLATSKHYKDRLLHEAVHTWSGGHNTNAYLATIEQETQFSRLDYIDDDLLRTPEKIISLAKAMAKHETGADYPMNDAEWGRAYSLYNAKLNGVKPEIKIAKKPPVAAPLEEAIKHLGQEEVPGPVDNPFINKCFDEIGLPHLVDDDPWCAAFVGYMLKSTGHAYLHKRADARAYLDYGERLDEPEVGALAVMWREDPKSWKGHVGFVESWTDKTVTIVGGNQSDSVSRMTVPRVGRRSQILGYRRAIPGKAPITEVVSSDSVKYKAGGLLAAISTAAWATWQSIAEYFAMGWAALSSVWNDAPEIATGVSSQVNAFQQISVFSGLPWPAYLSLFIVILVLFWNLSETWSTMRNRQRIETTANKVRAG